MQAEQTIEPILKISFYQKAVYTILEKIYSGSVTIVDQQRKTFGDIGHELSANIIIHDQLFYREVFVGGSLGFARAYILGYWDTDCLTKLIQIFARNKNVADYVEGKFQLFIIQCAAKIGHMLDHNSKKGARKNISTHYDLGNNFFELFLDKHMMYSSAVFNDAEDLEEATINKLHNICSMLELTPQDHVLEIGSGWGGFAIYAAQQYGCKVTTTTISRQQYEYAKKRVISLQLQDRVHVILKDYRDLTGKYDKLVSIEMIEAVGHQYFKEYFKQCCKLVKDNGLFVLQAITIADQYYDEARKQVDFIKKYIFPGGCLPSLATIMQNIARDTNYSLVALQNIGLEYAKTLDVWQQRFIENQEQIRALGFDEQFIRKWLYYFSYCEAGFREHSIHTYQLKFAKPRHSNTE